MAGKDVLDPKAVKIGVVKDLSLDEGGNVYLVVEGEKGKERSIPFGHVARIGDVVLLRPPLGEPDEEDKKEEVPEPTPTPPVKTGLACPSCGHENRPGTNFCVKCGTKMAE